MAASASHPEGPGAPTATATATSKKSGHGTDKQPTSRHEETSGVPDAFLQTWRDPFLELAAQSSCVDSLDANLADEAQLVLACQDGKLRVIENTRVVAERNLIGAPCGLVCLRPKRGERQVVAVASGTYMFVYRNFKPYFKFKLPETAVDAEEKEIWANLMGLDPRLAASHGGAPPPGEGFAHPPHPGPEPAAGSGTSTLSGGSSSKSSIGIAGEKEEGRHSPAWVLARSVEQLRSLRHRGGQLTFDSADLILKVDGEDGSGAVEQVLRRAQATGRVLRATVVTVVSKLGHRLPLAEDPEGVTSAILGTEGRAVLALEPDCTRIAFAIGVPSVPVAISGTGCLSSDHRIAFTGRDGKIRFIRNRTLSADTIEPALPATDVLLTETHTVVATAGKEVLFYGSRGKRLLFQHTLPAHAVALRPLPGPRCEGSYGSLVVVALRDGSVLVLDGPQVVSESRGPGRGRVVGAFVGAFGREECAVCSLGQADGFVVRTLRRRARLSAQGTMGGPGTGLPGGPASAVVGGGGGSSGAAAGLTTPSHKRLTPAEIDTPLPLPKRTRAFLEVAERELADPGAVHVAFQRGLARTKLAVARAFVEHVARGVEGAGGSPAGAGAAEASRRGVALRAQADGMGPHFRLRVEASSSAVAVTGATLVVQPIAARSYAVRPSSVSLQCIAPGAPAAVDVSVDWVGGESPPSLHGNEDGLGSGGGGWAGGAGAGAGNGVGSGSGSGGLGGVGGVANGRTIRVSLVHPGSTQPLVQLRVVLPEAELEEA